MSKLIRTIPAAFAAALAILLVLPAAAAPISITGQVTYRERIALPPEAVLTIQLVDTSIEGAPVRIGDDAVIEGPGQVPLQFVLSFDDEVLGNGHSYSLVATISAGNQIWFRNRTPFPVDPKAPATPVLIIVNFIGGIENPADGEAVADPAPQQSAVELPDEPAELAVSAELFDTIWAVRTMAGYGIIDSPQTTLSITADRRAGGVGGCNNYFAEAYFDGPSLAFGDIVATKMACPAPVMDQETAFFKTLAAVRGYEIDAGNLYLLDADGNQILGFGKVAAD